MPYPVTTYLNSIRLINLSIISGMTTLAVIHGGLIYKVLENKFPVWVAIIAAIAGGVTLALGVFGSTVNKDKIHHSLPVLLAVFDSIGVVLFLGYTHLESYYLGILFGIIIYAFAFMFQKKSNETLTKPNETKSKLDETKLRLNETAKELQKYKSRFVCEHCNHEANTQNSLKTFKHRCKREECKTTKNKTA